MTWTRLRREFLQGSPSTGPGVGIIQSFVLEWFFTSFEEAGHVRIGGGETRGTCCDHCYRGRGAHNARHPGPGTPHWRNLLSECYWDNKGRGVINLGNKTQWSKWGRHMTPASSHQLCPLHFIVPGSVSIISCPVSHLTHDSDPGPGGHWRNYSWIPHNESQANYGSNLVGASIKVLHHSLSFIKCLGGAG